MESHDVRRRLLERRAALLQLCSEQRREQETVREPEPDALDLASEHETEERLEALLSSERRELREIDEALSRLDRGLYGKCAVCRDAIEPKRLRALPYASKCEDCAA